jgi:hypothetical protein
MKHTTKIERASGIIVRGRPGTAHGGVAEQLGKGGHGGLLGAHTVHGGAFPARVVQRRRGVIAALLGLGDLRVQLHDGRVRAGHLEPRSTLGHVRDGTK